MILSPPDRNRLFAFGPRALLLLLLSFTAAVSSTLHAQLPSANDSTPSCTPPVLNATFRFAERPPHRHTIALIVTNISADACRVVFQGVPNFVPSRVEKMGPPPTFCTLCLGGVSDQRRRPAASLRPGDTAYVTFTWNTVSTDDTACYYADWATFPTGADPRKFYLLASKSEFPPICSPVEISDFNLGHFGAPEATPSISIATDRDFFYQDERFALRAVTFEAGAHAQPPDSECPTVFRVARSPDGDTRFDEVSSNWSPCHSLVDHSSHRVKLDVDSGALSAWGGIGIHRFQILQRISDDPADQRLAASNVVSVDIRDPLTITHNWSPEQQGVHIALNTPKLTYKLGEDIPLNIAAEVLTTQKPVYGEPNQNRGAFFNGFPAFFHLEILDDDGPIPGSDNPANLYRFFGGSSGPSICPGALTPHTIMTFDRTLAKSDMVPTHPGTYKLVLTWTPFTGEPACPERRDDSASVEKRKTLTTVHSVPVFLRITGTAPPSLSPTAPDYTAWKSHFTLEDTSFGERTALLDAATHLEWLRVTLTQNLEESKLRSEMAPNGAFAGWRFATLDEVRTFFTDFTGSPDGKSENLAIERKLLRLLGGQTFTLSSLPPNASPWIRNSLRISIAGLTPATHDQTPRNPAQPAGAPPPCSTCGSGFLYHYAYIADDSNAGKLVGVQISPDEGGWTSSEGVHATNGTFLVRLR